MFLILLITILYIVFNIATIILFGIPKSLSETFYLFKNKKEWMKIFFPLMLLSIGCCLLPYWLNLTNNTNFQFLPFLSLLCILLTSFSPSFRSNFLEKKVHSISATCSAIFAMLWIIIATNLWWLMIIWFFIFLVLAYLTKTLKKSKIYWLENIAILSICTVLLLS